MCEPFHSGSACLSGYPLGRLDMDGMKRLRSVLDVKADRIHHSVSSVNSIGHRPIIVNIGFDRLKLRIIKTEQPVSAIGMP